MRPAAATVCWVQPLGKEMGAVLWVRILSTRSAPRRTRLHFWFRPRTCLNPIDRTRRVRATAKCPRSRQESTLGGHIVKNLSTVPTTLPGCLGPVLARTFVTKVVVDPSYGPACRLPFARVCKPDLPFRFGLCEFWLWPRGTTANKDAREGC